MIRFYAALILISWSLFCLAQDSTDSERYTRAIKHHDAEIARFRAMPDVREVDHPDVIQFINKSKGIVILATKMGHPAHPAMVMRQALEENGQLAIKMTSASAGDKQALKTWIDYMAAEDQKAVDRKRNE